MDKIIIIQARMNSKRLPGKVILPICKIPQALLTYKRAINSGLEAIIATSNHMSDDILSDILSSNNVNYFRGNLNNPLKRIVNCLAKYKSNTVVVRLTADNVFPDGSLIEELIDDFIQRSLKYLTTNDSKSGLPKGLSVEITRLKYLREADNKAKTKFEKEHVTPFIINKYGKKIFTKYKLLNASSYNCTIDKLEEYIFLSRLLNSQKNIVNVSSIYLTKKLIKETKKNVNANNINKIILGGAQLGMKYGITNRKKLTKNTTSKLIKFLTNNGLKFVDTAYSYGDSEAIIGNFNIKNNYKLEVITKLKKIKNLRNTNEFFLKKTIKNSVYNSCKNLKVKKLYVILIHDYEDILIKNKYVLKCLLKLKKEGIIENIGVSVQNPEELEQCLKNKSVSYIQLPFNIIDHRWSKYINKIMEIKKNRNLIIHSRSIFLQGLLLTKQKRYWKKAFIDNNKEIILKLIKICRKLEIESINELCIRYSLSQNWIDKIIIGMSKISHAKKNIKYINKDKLSNKSIDYINKNKPRIPIDTLNPALWLKN